MKCCSAAEMPLALMGEGGLRPLPFSSTTRQYDGGAGGEGWLSWRPGRRAKASSCGEHREPSARAPTSTPSGPYPTHRYGCGITLILYAFVYNIVTFVLHVSTFTPVFICTLIIGGYVCVCVLPCAVCLFFIATVAEPITPGGHIKVLNLDSLNDVGSLLCIHKPQSACVLVDYYLVFYYSFTSSRFLVIAQEFPSGLIKSYLI